MDLERRLTENLSGDGMGQVQDRAVRNRGVLLDPSAGHRHHLAALLIQQNLDDQHFVSQECTRHL